MKPTGTNGPTDPTQPPPRPVRPPGGRSKRHASAMRYPNPTPAHHLGRGHDQARQAWRRPQRQGHARTFPFPNPEAKTASADGTAPARVWESRTPPPAHHKEGGPATGPPFFSRTPATHDHAHTQSIRAPATVNTRHAHGATPAQPQCAPHTRPHTHTQSIRTRTGPHPHGHTAPQKPPTRPQRHTRKHSMSTQVDAVGYETCV